MAFINPHKVLTALLIPLNLLGYQAVAQEGVKITAQTITQQPADSMTLDNCVAFALQNHTTIRQAVMNEEITDATIKSKLADWFPQINLGYNYQHNFDLATNMIGNVPTRFGVRNTSGLQLTGSQQIFNREVLLAQRTKDIVRLQSQQLTADTKIDVAVNVMKAFYDVIATLQQISVTTENITRLESSLKNARAQFEEGIADNTDYKRATIALNNAKASQKSFQETLQAKKEYLKFLMGYDPKASLNIAYDPIVMERAIGLDTTAAPDYTSRIEYKLLSTQQSLLEANLKYEKWAFLPNLSANGTYARQFMHDNFGQLYNTSFPNSYAGITLGFPIFQGGKRKSNITIANLQLDRTRLDVIHLENSVNAEYAAAIAGYKSSLSNYYFLEDNVRLAKEVYEVIELQYNSGIKAYIEVINAEADLRTSQINYYEALFQVLSNKIDVQRSLGEINY